MLNIIKDRRLYKHCLLSIVTLIFLFLVWLKYLDYYTMHQRYIKMPDFNNILSTQLDSVVKAYDIRYEISDTIFDRDREKGIVVNQDPEPFTEVKKNRKVYLTINSFQTQKVIFPNIYDLSLRQAIRKLRNVGLEIGKLEYRPNIATNKVLNYKVNGNKIIAGQELYIGTVIDLVIGKGLGIERILVPDLVGLTRREANVILKSVSLNIGSEVFYRVEDSLSAIVFKQFPVSNNYNVLSIGSAVDLFFQDSKTDTIR